MSSASLCLSSSIDPSVPETLALAGKVAYRLLVLTANSIGFAAVMWLILAAPGLLR